MKEIVKYVRFYNRHIRVCKYIILISVIVLIKFDFRVLLYERR